MCLTSFSFLFLTREQTFYVRLCYEGSFFSMLLKRRMKRLMSVWKHFKQRHKIALDCKTAENIFLCLSLRTCLRRQSCSDLFLKFSMCWKKFIKKYELKKSAAIFNQRPRDGMFSFVVHMKFVNVKQEVSQSSFMHVNKHGSWINATHIKVNMNSFQCKVNFVQFHDLISFECLKVFVMSEIYNLFLLRELKFQRQFIIKTTRWINWVIAIKCKTKLFNIFRVYCSKRLKKYL